MSLAVFHFACVICNLSPVTCHLSPEHHSGQLELLESPRMFGNAAARGLLIDNKNNNDKIIVIKLFLRQLKDEPF